MIRTEVHPATRMLAERLIALESVAPIISEDRLSTCRVCEKLRRPLSHLVGPAGVNSLWNRALTLSKRESPVLSGVQVMKDGSLEGFEGEAAEASSVLVAHLIQLLVTFIGEGLTLRLLQEIWPDIEGLYVPGEGESYEQ